jgi:hypothetical protein
LQLRIGFCPVRVGIYNHADSLLLLILPIPSSFVPIQSEHFDIQFVTPPHICFSTASMASRFSLQADDGSVKSSTFSHDGVVSEPHQDEPENDQTPLMRFLRDPYGSTTFDRISQREAGLPIHVFPRRIRLPGEQPPYRLVDGVSATAPRRSRRGTQMSTATASVSGEEGTSVLPRPPKQPVDLPPTSHPPSDLMFVLSSSAIEHPIQGKDKARLGIHSTRDALRLHSSAGRKQNQFNLSGSKNPPQQAASHPLSGQLPYLPPDQHWEPFSTDSAPSNQCSSVILSNNMVWNLDQALFKQNQPYQSIAPDPYHFQTPGSVADDPNSESAYYLPASSANSPFDNVDAVSMQSTPCFASGRHSSPQDSNSNSDSSIPSLTFQSPSSQPHSSPFDSSSNYSPPAFGEPGGEQAEEPHFHLQIWEQAPDLSIGHRKEGEKAAGEDKEWEDLINFGD